MQKRKKPNRPYPSQRYGVVHKTLRRRLAPVVEKGTVECARCGEFIEPGSKWHLDHRDDGHGWLGPSHESCNARAGWEKMVAANGNGAFRGVIPDPWSRSWHDDPPVGTEVFLGGGLVEVHVGRGIWQTITS